MTVLSNLQVLAVRSIYHQAQVQSSIYAFTLESASKDSTSQDLIYNAEKCSCPAIFTGLSCEGCLPGHRRVNNVLFGGQCEACSCHGHSQACDPFTGHCSECSRNTTGSHCELCAPGFYGNPSLGADLGTCLPCGCPLLDSMNNFSPTCTLTSSIESGMQDYACTACPTGYEGPKCEWCVDDFFGQPMVPGNFCQPCNCSGNVDLAAIGNCDKISGRCLKCIGNTIGYNCELCKPDYYGSALQHDCKACRCNLFGSVISQCDSQSGVCQCKPHFVGTKCDRCEDGYGDVENGCQLCSCDSIGSFSNLCDPFSGQCQCKPGVFGKRCDSCLSGYYGFGDNGCDYCNCYTYGSVDDGKCDVITGQCFCREHVRGEKCDTCEDGYYNITSGSGCKSCECHSEASLVSTCDSINGQCRCKDGVTGLKCDRCSPNFFGLSENGCQQCPLCPAPGHVCDPVSGQCVCPPYTVGEVCEHCAPNSWNYDAYKGCQPCECDTSGSTDASCDALTGACNCRSGYTGKKCDQCTLGHYKFPSCFKCNCNQPGTESSTCSNQTNCSCDDHGECLCKKNVAGEKCDKCNATAFSLEADNPKGCTECFCFKLTPFCIQSSYIWRQVTSTERRMAFFDRPWVRSEKRHGLNVLPAEPSTLNVYQTRDGPLYWSLPAQFLGDKITSYNGYLRLRITNQNGNYLEGPSRPEHRSFDRYPLIVLVGNYRIVLEHYKNVREISDEGIYIVKFREDMWKNQLKPKKEVDRQTLMIALQNVQAVFVRATFVERISEASLADVSMDVGISQNSSIALSNPSIGVEHCDCPTPYAGASCQHPADGYCRKKKSGYLDSENDLDLIGTSIPCSCHSHSNVCDMETCRCLDCQHNTTGDFCEQCSTGFYGNAKLGTEFDCRKCACPLIDHSFSKSCYATTHNDFGYVCDQCHAGHTGVRCEKCVNGYFGDPLQTGKPCQLCTCNKFGALYDTCDSTSGQCQCRHGVTGRDCSECRPRYALIGSDCRSCDLGCTRELMIDADHLESVLMSHNFTGLVPAPWGRLTRVENTTSFLEAKFNKLSGKLDDGTTGVDLALKVADAKRRYLDTQTMHASAQFTRDSAIDTNKNASIRLNESESLRKQVGELSSKLRGTKDFLVRYKESGPAGGSKASVEAERMLNESTGYLKTINEIKEIVEKRSNLAEQSLKDAEQQLRQVKAKIFNDTITKQVAEKLQTLYEVVDDARKIVFQNVWRNLSSAESTLKITQKMLTEFERLTNEISMGAKEARKLLDNSSSLHSKSIMSNLDADAFFSESRDPMLDHLKNATNLCEDKVNQFNQLYPEYEQKYLLPARRHADELVANADHIKNLFSPIQDKAILPVDASASYANIKLAIDEALSAASGAVDAAKNSFDQVSNDKKFVQQSKTLLNSGENLLNTTLGMQHTTKGLTQETSRYRTRQQTIQDTNLKTRQSTAQITKFDKFDDIAEKVEDSIKLAKEARAEVDDLAKRNNKLQDKINELNKSTKSLSALDGKSVAGLADAVKNAVAEIKTAQEGIKLLEHSGPEFDLKISNMSSSIAKLKEKIKEAREKASKVKISVHSKEPDTCYRSYISTAVPSPANSLYIEYRPTDNVDNSLIFVTKTNQTRARTAEYLALQLIDQRFMFLWNVGGGTDGNRKITLPHRIISTAKKSQPLWYKINVERKGNGANLTVGIPEMDKTKPDNQMAVYKYYSQIVADPDDQVTNLPESDSPAIFNTIPGLTRVSLGLNVDRQYIPRELNVAKFLGTVGQVKFDGNNVPLWNFIDSAGACTPYYSSMPAEIATTDYMFADGYAQIPRTGGYNSQTTYVIIKFASYSENGLLYFRGNPSTKDFISIELEDGRIKTQINLGGNSKTRLLTEHNYNDGKRYVVQVRRSQLNGNFKGLEADTDHMIGGVAESYTKHIWRSFNIQWKGFYGCIMLSTLNVDNKYLTINDANVKTFSLKPTCRMSDPSGSGVLLSADRVVTFKGDGSFVITGLEIKPYPVSSFSVNFRTRKDKGLIFYQSSRVTTRKRRDSPAESGFIAGYIEDCLFNLAVGTNSDNVVHLESPIKVCDGRLHTAFFKRKELEILLFVDDQFVAKGKLSQNRTIGNKEWSQLFLGGLGSIKAPKEELSSYTPFTGCISDLHFNYRRLILVPQRLDKATLGVCVNPASEIPQSQQKEGYLSDGIDQYEQEDAYDGDDEAHPDSLENFDDDIMMSDASSHRHRGLTHHKFKKRPNKDNSNENIQSKCELVPDNHIAGAARYGSSPGTYSSPGLPVRKRHERILDFSSSLSFRTWSSNGTILAWTNKNLHYYLSIFLNDASLVLLVKMHKMKRHVILNLTEETSWPFNDGLWHSVTMNKRGRVLIVQVDKQSEKQIKLPLKWALKREKGGLTVGGSKKTTALKLHIPSSFVGCIRDFVLDGQKYDLLAGERFHGRIQKCHESTTMNSVHFMDQNSSLLIDVDHLISGIQRNLSFEFRLDGQDGGHLLTLINNSTAGNMHLEFAQSHTLRLRLKNKLFSYSVGEHFCRNQWNTVVFESSSEASAVFIGRTLAFQNIPFDSSYVQIALGNFQEESSFQGCIRNVHLNGHLINFFQENLKSKRVAINECSSSG